MEIGINRAKKNLYKLVARVQAGDRVFLTNHGRRIIELVPVKPETSPAPNRGYGMFKHLFPAGFSGAEWKKKHRAQIMKDMGLGADGKL